MMNPRRFSALAGASCGASFLAAFVVAWFGGFGARGLENTAATPIVDSRQSSFTPRGHPREALQATATEDVAETSDKSAMADATATSGEANSIEEAPVHSSPMPPSETSAVRVATASPSDPLPVEVSKPVRSIEVVDECFVVDVCVDRYLWALYQRTPKEDTIKVHERRKEIVKKKGKTVTRTKDFTRLVDEDFTWKDPKAAEKSGMTMMDYVIGGMDRRFKLRLFHVLHAAEQAGLSPGITSAFRDDYRQSIASGLKAADNRSYHGGSFRGGYGHGLAADVVSVEGRTRDERWASSDRLWKWIDAHGSEFGIGRPYVDRDPPHVAPIDGTEYAAHHPTGKTRLAGSAMKKGKAVATGHVQKEAKRSKNARSSRVRTI
jgi:hypothetical protein